MRVAVVLLVLAAAAGCMAVSSDKTERIILSMLEEQDEVDAVAVQPITESTDLSLLEVSGKCKSGHYCAMPHGVCCKGGGYCCPQGTECNGKNKCKKSSLTRALRAAKAKMQEEGKKEIKMEAHRKNKSEKAQKRLKEEKTKNTKERAAKTERRTKEAVAKNNQAHKEKNQKAAAKRKERGQKSKEKRQKKLAALKAGHARTLEKAKKKHAKMVEKAKKAKKLRESKKKKAAEKKRKAKERVLKIRAKERRMKAKERSRKRSWKVIRTNFRPKRRSIVAHASQLKETGEQTFMFWVYAEGTTRGWSNLIHKGRQNCCRPGSRSPAIFFRPGSSLMTVVSGTKKNGNNIIKISNRYARIPWHRWTHVVLTHKKGEASVWINGRRVGRQSTLAPVPNNAPLYGSDPWYAAALVRIADLRYASVVAKPRKILEIYKKKSYGRKPVYKAVRLFKMKRMAKGRKMSGRRITHNRQFTYTFWVKPSRRARYWQSIWHKGSNNHQRNPAFWFIPGTTRLHVVSGTRRSWNDHVNTRQQLSLNRWSHVALTHKATRMNVYINGRRVISISRNMPYENTGPLWLSDPWHHSCDCYVANLEYTKWAVPSSYILKSMKKRPGKVPQPMLIIKRGHWRVRRNYRLRSTAPVSKTMTWMFWVRPIRPRRGWCNLMHRGNRDNQRSPAVFFYPSRTRLHVRSGTHRSWNYGVDPGRHLSRNRWLHVAVYHKTGLFRVYYDGRLVANHRSAETLIRQAPVWGSNPWYNACYAYLADLRFYYQSWPSTSEIAKIRKQRTYR